MEYNGSALVATQIYDLLNKSVETTSTATTKANAISRIIDEFSKTDNAFEMCKQGLYVYRPFQSPNGDLGIPQTPTIADDDRQFASEYLKDCCTLFNVDENICWGMYEKYMETLPTKPNLVYDHLEMYKLKDACKKMKNLASNNELDYKTIETFLKSFQQIYGNSNTDEFLNSTNNRSTGIMNGQSIPGFFNILEHIVRATWDIAMTKILGQQAPREKLQKLRSNNGLEFILNPAKINQEILKAKEKKKKEKLQKSDYDETDKTDYDRIIGELHGAGYKLDRLRKIYKNEEDFQKISQIGSTLFGHFTEDAFNNVIKFGEFYFSNRTSLIDIIIFAFDRYASIVYEMVPSHPINSPIDKFVKALINDWIGIRLLVQIAQFQYNNSNYFNMSKITKYVYIWIIYNLKMKQ